MCNIRMKPRSLLSQDLGCRAILPYRHCQSLKNSEIADPITGMMASRHGFRSQISNAQGMLGLVGE